MTPEYRERRASFGRGSAFAVSRRLASWSVERFQNVTAKQLSSRKSTETLEGTTALMDKRCLGWRALGACMEVPGARFFSLYPEGGANLNEDNAVASVVDLKAGAGNHPIHNEWRAGHLRCVRPV